MSKLFLESLDSKRLSVFTKLKAFKKEGVLGGGTALSLQIGHRVSFDFDILVDKKLDDNFWELAKKVFGNDFSERLFLEQLTYWEDVVEYEIEYIKKQVKPETIKSFLEKGVERYKKREFQK